MAYDLAGFYDSRAAMQAPADVNLFIFPTPHVVGSKSLLNNDGGFHGRPSLFEVSYDPIPCALYEYPSELLDHRLHDGVVLVK